MEKTVDNENEWFDHAKCKHDPNVGPSWFYPPRGRHAHELIDYCKGCPVKDDCLDYALRHKIRSGVWGGVSEHQRRVMRRYINKRDRDEITQQEMERMIEDIKKLARQGSDASR